MAQITMILINSHRQSLKVKNTIKAGGSTAICKMCEWMMEWVIPLTLLRLLEHLAVLINDSITIKKSMMVALFEET